jgi:hypothetical protein
MYMSKTAWVKDSAGNSCKYTKKYSHLIYFDEFLAEDIVLHLSQPFPVHPSTLIFSFNQLKCRNNLVFFLYFFQRSCELYLRISHLLRGTHILKSVSILPSENPKKIKLYFKINTTKAQRKLAPYDCFKKCNFLIPKEHDGE